MRFLSSSRGYARSTASKLAPGIMARAAATCSIQNTVVASEYFSAFPTEMAKRSSVAAIRSIA